MPPRLSAKDEIRSNLAVVLWQKLDQIVVELNRAPDDEWRMLANNVSTLIASVTGLSAMDVRRQARERYRND